MCLSKKKVIVKLCKPKDSIEICLLKKRLLWIFLNVKIPLKYAYWKKVIVKHFKPKDSNKIYLLKKNVIVKFFKPKDSNEICLLKKKAYCETF